MRTARRLVLLIVLVVLGGAFLWWWTGGNTAVTAIAPFRGTATEIVYGTGSVEPVRWAKVASLVRDRIIEVCNCEGKAVRKGGVLAA